MSGQNQQKKQYRFWGWTVFICGVCAILASYAVRAYVDWLARRSVEIPPSHIGLLHDQLSEVSSTIEPLILFPDSTNPEPVGVSPRNEALREDAAVSHATDVIEGEYILTWQHVADRNRLLSLAKQYDVEILDSSEHAMRVRSLDRRTLARFLDSVPPAVLQEPNVRIRIPLLDAVEDSLSPPETPYAGFGERALAWLGIPDPQPEWGSGVKLAVLDTGITGVSVSRHINLTKENLEEGHGSLVAGIARQLVPGVELIDVKVMHSDGTGDSFTVAKGIREAVDAGADIINMSIGTRGDSAFLLDAVRYAQEQGVLIVASAGNEGVARVSYPAAYENVLSVAAVDAEEQHLYFSNRGDEVDISAPGVGIAVALGAQGELVPFSGTSAAAPFVSATAGLALWRNRSLDSDALRELLTSLANDTGEPGNDTLTGAGIVSPRRLQELGQENIIDMVVLRPFYHLDENNAVSAISVAAENRGTTFLPVVEMAVTVNDAVSSLTFQDLPPGATVAHQMDAKPYARADGTWDVTVRVPVQGDVRPGDNQRRVIRMQVEP